MPIHVAIHDVSPVWEREIDLALEAVHAAGARPALLVVPDYHESCKLTEHPAYAARLRELQRQGHEVYLHGFSHRADRASIAGDLALRMRRFFWQRVASAGEAEFAGLSFDEASARVDEGERVLEQAGLRIDGFVAPAWSMPKSLLDVLAARGYQYTEDHTHVHDPAAGRRSASVVLNYASRSPLRLFSSVAYCRAAKHARRVVPARIAIHPADMRFRLLREEIRTLLNWGRGDFVARGTELLR